MKFEQVKAWKMAGKMAAVLALGAVASTQSAQSSRGEQARKGLALPQVSLANDIRTPEEARRKIVLERPQLRGLELVFKLRPHEGSDLRALIPVAEDMERTVILANGTPGGMAVIHLDTRAPELRRAGGTKIVGFFDEHGRFSVVLPASFDARGIFAHGEEALVRVAHGGRAVPASKRPASDDMDVEETIAQAYFNWLRYYVETNTNLQFRTGGKMRAARLDDADASDSIAPLSSGSLSRGVGHAQRGSGVDDDTQSGGDGEDTGVNDPADPVGARGALEKIRLQRPRSPAIGGGHTLRGSDVDDDTQSGGDGEGTEVNDPADPVGARGALEKIRLQRPRSPAIGGGHTLRGSDVDDDTQSGGDGEGTGVDDPADPVSAARAFGKIKLQRPAPAPTPTQRDEHVLQRKL